MAKLSITLTFDVPDNAPHDRIVKALSSYHTEQYRAMISDLVMGAGLPSGLIRDGKFEAGYLPHGAFEDEYENQTVKWLEQQIEDQSIDIHDLCRRTVRWGLRAPTSVYAEIDERMGEGDDEGGGFEDPPTQLPFIAPPLAPTSNLPGAGGESVPSLVDVLDEVEGFIAGFENDETQEGIPAMLERVRALHKRHSETTLVDGRTAFLAVFHGIIGAYPGGEGNGHFRGLWPVAGALDHENYVELRNEAMLKAIDLLGAGFCTRVQADNWLESAGWIVPEA